MNHTEKRKIDHIEICSTESVESKNKTTLFECVDFVHSALPEINKYEINLSTKIFGKKLNTPLIISGMTGGHESAEKINKNLAKAAQELGIGFGVGSQRVMLENPKLAYTYQVRDVAPSILLLGNLGVHQLEEYTVSEIEASMAEIGADMIAIHLNNLQEAVQPEGDTTSKGYLKIISEFSEKSKLPVIIKETGAGISKETAKEILKTKISGIDVGGAGGTSFAGVETLRKGSDELEDFWDWGIPTAASILEVRSVSKKIPLIASCGIRTGLDIAKAIALGADAAGIALPLLKPAQESPEAVVSKLNEITNGLRTAMFLCRAKNIQELSSRKIVITGKLSEWQKNRKI